MSLEHMDCHLNIRDISLYIDVIYRPPPSTKSVFFHEWASYLERFTEIQEEVIPVGDVNFHVNDTSDGVPCNVISLLDAHGLSQHVCESTHKKNTH